MGMFQNEEEDQQKRIIYTISPFKTTVNVWQVLFFLKKNVKNVKPAEKIFV